jgi:hypothetical protein
MSNTLTRRQDTFITEYAKGRNATQAAIRAGYAPSSARQRGYELVNNSDIQQRLLVMGVIGLDTLADVALHGKNDTARVNAAIALMERAFGKMPATTQQPLAVSINRQV